MERVMIKDLKKGEFFRRIIKGQPSSKVYVKGDYDRSSKTYSCFEYFDVNHEVFIKSSCVVCVGFTF